MRIEAILVGAAGLAASGFQEDGFSPFLGGVGGIYILAEPGELVVEVEKRDLNRRGVRTDLRALLVGPDRQTLQEAVIPDDGLPRGSGPGPPRRARLSARLARKGVCVLNITVSNDRYGEDAAWSFRTNARRYLVETSRGHRDEAHQEPIVLLSPEREGDVCFQPRPGGFRIEATGLPAGGGEPVLHDSEGSIVAALKPDGGGNASVTVPAGPRGTAPWRLHLPRAQGTIHIDGVTRWEKGDVHPDLCCWTPEPGSWFPLLEHRWLLTPYRRTLHGPPGREGRIDFLLRNDADRPKTIRLEIEFPAGRWPARLDTDRSTLKPGASAPVTVHYTVPAGGEARSCHLRATPEDAPDFSAFSTLTVKGGEAPAAQPLNLPLVLRPYQHENELLGYFPDYPVDSQPYFDLKNRPFIRTAAGLATLRDGTWATSPQGASSGTAPSKIAYDRDNNLYLLSGRTLLHSSDGGRTFGAVEIPARRGLPSTLDLETFTGHNVPDGPPPILRYTQTAADPQRIWRRTNDLELFLPRKEGGRIAIGEPILVSRKCIGLSAHSGIPASLVSRGSKVHLIWGEVTDPAEKVPGVPTYAATFDRETGKLGPPVLVGYGAPPNDVHNSPSITMDGRGFLHALTGTHGKPFLYARSLRPDDAGAGWTEAQPTGEGLPQTYIGFVCGPDDTLHLAFRLWRTGVEPFPAAQHAVLAYQRKRPDRPWDPPRVMVVPPFSEYSVFYHRLTLDRAGRLFLSYDCWSTFWFYRNDQPFRRRALMTSSDGGETWKLAESADLGRAS